MTSDILLLLFKVNLAAGAAILLILAVRQSAQRLLGARLAYALWLIVPFAMVACLIPAREIVVVTSASVAPLVAPSKTNGLALCLLALWIVGCVLTYGLLAWWQYRFVASLGGIVREGDYWRANRAGTGPAVIGVLFPRIVLPSDFETHFDSEEQALILAHEKTHLASGDALVNACLALFQGFAWFNPLVHIAVNALRQDQELACDASVVAKRSSQRRVYALALLKTQLIANSLPLGCYWPSNKDHPLKERIAMLKSRSPSRVRILCGVTAIAALCLGVGYAAWAAQPARVSSIPADKKPADILDPATGNIYPDTIIKPQAQSLSGEVRQTMVRRAGEQDVARQITRAAPGNATPSAPAVTTTIRADRISVEDTGNITASGKSVTITSAPSADTRTTRDGGAKTDTTVSIRAPRTADTTITSGKTETISPAATGKTSGKSSDATIEVRRSASSGDTPDNIVVIKPTGAATNILPITQ